MSRLPRLLRSFVLFALLSLAWVFVGACSSTPTSPVQRVAPTQQKVLATIGDQTISLAQFKRDYKRTGQGLTPQEFLQKMVEEKLLLLEARQRHLAQAPKVQETHRRAQAQQAIKRGFESWFNEGTIGILELRKAYKAQIRRFVRPKLLFAWHILARFPKPTRAAYSLSAQEKVKQAAILKEGRALAHRIGKEALKLVIAANPKDGKAFAAVIAPLERKYNTPDPRLQAWTKGVAARFHNKPPINGDAMINAIWEASKELKKFVVCGLCNSVRWHMRKLWRTWTKKMKVTPARVLKVTSEIVRFGNFNLDRIRARDLGVRGPFAYEDMLTPFSKAAFALKDRTFTKKLVRTKFGYHIIFRVRSTKPLFVSFKEATPVLRKQLYLQQRAAKFQQWLKMLYKQTPTGRYLGRLKK